MRSTVRGWQKIGAAQPPTEWLIHSVISLISGSEKWGRLSKAGRRLEQLSHNPLTHREARTIGHNWLTFQWKSRLDVSSGVDPIHQLQRHQLGHLRVTENWPLQTVEPPTLPPGWGLDRRPLNTIFNTTQPKMLANCQTWPKGAQSCVRSSGLRAAAKTWRWWRILSDQAGFRFRQHEQWDSSVEEEELILPARQLTNLQRKYSS